MESSERPRQPHTFNINSFSLENALLTIVAAEHESNRRDERNPANWLELIIDQIDQHDIIVPEYVPAELRAKAFKFPYLGKVQANQWGKSSIDPFFGPIVEHAVGSRKTIMAVDPANTALLGFYQAGEHIALSLATMPYTLPVVIWDYLAPSGLQIPKIPYTYEDPTGEFPFTSLDKALPTTIDARRLITAKGLRQIARENPNSRILHITPPAHASRIEWYLNNSNDARTRLKSVLYSLLPLGITRSVRTFAQDANLELQVINSKPIKLWNTSN